MSVWKMDARRMLLIITILGVLVAVSACNRSKDGAESDAVASDLFRNPRPTFTPTSDVTVVEAPSMNNAATPEAPLPPIIDDRSSRPAEPPRAVINAPLVNLRRLPNTNSDVVAAVERGGEFDIVGRSQDNEWWQVCCQLDTVVWVSKSLVDSDGDVDSVPLADGSTGVSSPAQVEMPVSGIGGATSGPVQFELIAKEQFPESNLVRIYLYLYDGNEALAGYRARIIKDGRVIDSTAESFGGQAAFTWPFQDARQRYQNLKIEITDEPPAGLWMIQPIDEGGNPSGPVAEFTLQENDANQELYVRYELVD